eukprot:8045212-Pyramimonas_sp.AAC.1
MERYLSAKIGIANTAAPLMREITGKGAAPSTVTCLSSREVRRRTMATEVARPAGESDSASKVYNSDVTR